MHLRETLDYDADPDTVFAMLCDKAWREQVCERTHATEYDVSVDRRGDKVTVRMTRTLPAKVPDAIRKIVGNQIKIVQTERWGPPAADGRRKAKVEVDIVGQPANMQGTITLSPRASGSRESVDGEVKVRIPILGKKVEPEVVKAIKAALQEEQAAGRSYLASG